MSTNQTGIPKLYEWTGGMAAFKKRTDQFYTKVLNYGLLESVFKHMSKELHRAKIKAFLEANLK